MENRKKIGTLMVCLLADLILSTCGNPLEEDKATLIRTLVDGPLSAGIYLIYWNGKDKDQKTVAPGTYLCQLWAEDYQQEIEMTSMDGTQRKTADSTGTGGIYYNDRIPLHFLLEQNFPDPFYAKDGTNIPFEVPQNTYIKLTVHTKK
jgi:hypothetical protein